MIGIRADGNEKIGTGHIMRCLAIARELEGMGESPVFFCTEKNAAVKAHGFRCVSVGGAYDDLGEENLSPLLAEYGVTILLVDTYYADAAYFERIPCKTAYLFDWGDASAQCDLLIDYNINYADYGFPNAKKTLLGPKYAPLRREFRDICERDVSRVDSVFLTTGGTDENRVTEKILRRLRKERAFDEIRFCVLIGALNRWAEEVKHAAGQYGNVECYENVSDMAGLMKRCDAVLSAGGTTLYEICACALPCVTFSIADNQDELIAGFAQRGVMLSAGVFAQGEERCLDRIASLLKQLTGDPALRHALSQKAHSLVDGRGAERIARALAELESEK